MQQPKLLDELVVTPPSDKVGADTQTRFNYQNCWGLLKIIEALEKNESDFAVAFEFHDDVLFLNSETNPTGIDFCQVKSKKAGVKTLSSLTKSESKSGKSAASKLCSNALAIAGKYDGKFIFVSNVPYDCCGDKNDLCSIHLIDKYKNKLVEVLTKELPEFDLALLDKLHFHKSELPLANPEQYLAGKLISIFEQRFGHEHTNKVSLWLSNLAQSALKKSKAPPDEVDTVGTFMRSKCITSSEVLETLARIGDEIAPAKWEMFNDQLIKEGVSFPERIKMQERWVKSSSDLLDPSNQVIQTIQNEMNTHLDKLQDIENKTLTIIINELSEWAVKRVPWSGYDKHYLNTIAMRIYYEKITRIQKTS